MIARKVSWRNVRHHKEIYLFILPTLVLMGLFVYYPASNGLYHSLYRWNGGDIQEYRGLDNYIELFKTKQFWEAFWVAFLLGVVNVLKMAPAMLVAVLIHRVRLEKLSYLYRVLFVIPMVIPGIVMVLIWKFFFEPTAGILNTFLRETGLLGLLIRMDGMLNWGGVFTNAAQPAWLGNPKLAFTSLIIFGFPWVGTFAVLTYLAALQRIGADVYESAEIDGAGAWAKFRHVELPLIVSMIRLNLVFVILATVKDAALILLLFDMNGGPGGVVQVPALYMMREAFVFQQLGKACAIGIVLTLIVFLLSKVNEKLIRVET